MSSLAAAWLRADCTTVIVYRTPSKIVIGADTLYTVGFTTSSQRICKITNIGDISVAATGFVYDAQNAFDAYALARKARRHSSGIIAAARRFEQSARPGLERAMRLERQLDPATYKNENDPALSVLFAGIEDGVPIFAVISFFHSQNSSKPMAVTPHLDVCPGNACRPDGSAFFVLGDRNACCDSGRSAFFVLGQRYVPAPSGLTDDPVSAIRQFIQAKIDRFPKRVGGPIDILTISKDGEVWNQKGKCP